MDQVWGICPITGGVPTRMTEAGFARSCEAKRAASSSSDNEPGQATALVAFKVRKKLNACSACRGEKRPAELEIITITEVDMTVKSKNACEGCGKTKLNLTQCSGDLVCSSCAALYGAVNNRLAVVAETAKRLGKGEQLARLLCGEHVTVTVESTALKTIAGIIGYEEEDGDGLIGAVRDLFAKTSPTPVLDAGGDLLELRDILGMPFARVSELVAAITEQQQAFERYQQQCEHLASELREVEKLSAWKDDIFDSVREALDQPQLPVGDLAFHCLSLRQSADAALTLPVIGDGVAYRAKQRDSLLLDLALALLDGRVTGIAPNFISTMREAA